MERRLDHLHLIRPSDPQPFTAHRANGAKDLPIPPRDRGAHGQFLAAKLQQAQADSVAQQAQLAAAGVQHKEGLYLEFRLVAGLDEVLASFENLRSGIEVMNDRRAKDPRGNDAIYVTVFVPQGTVGYFLNKVEAYLTEEVPRSGKPKNRKLVESIEDVRFAVVKSFWTDKPELFPEAGQTIWWEIWLRTSAEEAIDAFIATAPTVGLRIGASRPLRFPDRAVLLAFGTREQLAASVPLLDSLAEVRRAKETAHPFIRMTAFEQGAWVRELAERTVMAAAGSPAVCIHDTGVNRGHGLLAPALAATDQHAWNPAWGVDDRHGHGTSMAGLALYGPLSEAMLARGPITLTHALESVKILPDQGENEPRLYGTITADAVALVEGTAARIRTHCMAVTARDISIPGRPSAWSAAVDALAMGHPAGPKRLFVLSAGNLEMRDLTPTGYTLENETISIHDPAQAWNALTVGAYTELETLEGNGYEGFRPVAPTGDLCPTSSTSLIWERSWPFKPDVVCEGGNAVTDGAMVDQPLSMQLLTTHHQPGNRPLTTFGDTSAAAALAANMAATLQSHYPRFWPETIRGLIVQSATWTPAMERRARSQEGKPKDQKNYLLRAYGYGVPNLERALRSARNDLTIIMQNELQPFVKDRSKEMDFFALPWPKQVLRDLGETQVELRVTLSYFIEPKPGSRGGQYRHRYASHGLRFDLKLPTERPEAFRKRLNAAALEEEEARPSASGRASEGWILGPQMRTNGSIHSDTWRGDAAALADREFIGVYPVVGWWRSHRLARWDQRVRYALIASIRTVETELEVDLYTAVRNQLTVETELGW